MVQTEKHQFRKRLVKESIIWTIHCEKSKMQCLLVILSAIVAVAMAGKNLCTFNNTPHWRIYFFNYIKTAISIVKRKTICFNFM